MTGASQDDRPRILLTGATGLIGSAILARLTTADAEIVAVSRGRAPRQALANVSWIRLDMRSATSPEAWRPHLAGVDVVINCAGVLQDNGRDSTAAAHRDGPGALFEAAEQAGVRRVIHFSAMGAGAEGLSDFSRSKRAGDEALMARDLDWVILRPSVVLGRPAFGGSALFRGLAAAPVLLRPPNAGKLQVVQLDEVVETVLFFLRPGAPVKVALELAGPEPLMFEEVVAAYRAWLGHKPAKTVGAPRWLMALAYGLGDFAGLLGWRPPVRSNARREMVRGATGDPTEWARLTGISPRSLQSALAAEPASVQEQWFARLYLLKPVVFTVFSLFWIGTGLISLGPGYQIGEGLMREGGAGALSGPSVVAGALADIAIGLAIAYRPTARLGLYAALAISLFYAVAGTLLLPRLWEDPLGPMWKIWPIVVFNLVALAILDER